MFLSFQGFLFQRYMLEMLFWEVDVQNKRLFLGHTKNGDGNGVQESLKDHLEYVAIRAKAYSDYWGYDFAGKVAGMFHDLGKYADQFQARLRDPKNIEARDHWSLGSLYVASKFVNSLPVALAIR